jgi:tetratricopeptide (TPR) repeat protein
VHHWFGILLTARGRFDEARAAIDRALAIAPASPALHAARGTVDLYARDAASAQRALRHAIQCDPTSASAHVLLGIALARQGLVEEALAVLERSLDLAGRMQPFMLAALTHVLASADLRANALEARTKLIDLANRYDISSFHLAAAHAAVGDAADALTALERAVERRDTWLLALKVHPWMDPLRRDARFKDMLAELEL